MTPSLAPFAILRVAGLPFALATGLVPERMRHALGAVRDARRTMATARPILETALHVAAATDDRELRRDVLSLKRDVHNARLSAISPERRDSIAQVLDHDTVSHLQAWTCAAATGAARAREVSAMLDDVVRQHIRPELAAIARKPEFLNPLALASPDLTRTLLADSHAPTQPASTKLDRSILAYVLRSTTKTSPFSGFLHTGVLIFTGSRSPWIDSRSRSVRTYVNRGLLALLAHQRAVSPRVPVDLTCDVHARWDAGTIESVGAVHVQVARRSWRINLARRLRIHPALADRLRSGLVRDAQGWSALLSPSGRESAEARALVHRLVDAGVLVPVPATDAYVDDVVAAHARTVPDHGAGAVVREALRDLAAAADQLASGDTRARLAAVSRAGAAYAEAWRAISDAPCVAVRNPLLEDGVLTRPVEARRSLLDGIERDLISALSPHVVERAESVRLRRAFVAAFGRGGTCRDVVGFLRDVPSVETTSEPARVDRPLVAVAVLAQLATDETGTIVAVINQLHTGGGPLYARFSAGPLLAAEQMRVELRAWISHVTAPRIPIDVPLCGECNPLQAHPRLTDRVLVLPGEPCTAASAVLLRETTLVHDAERDQLNLRGPRGEDLAPVYLGATLLSEASGIAYWLGVIGRPHEIQRPGAMHMPPVDTAEEVVRCPRRTSGSVVLQRETTWVRVERLRRCWFRSSGADRLLDVAAEVVALELPPRFFARRPLSSRDATDGNVETVKPLWVDTENPFCLDLFERFVEGVEWIACVEMWPEPAAAWPPIDEEPHVTELVLEVSL